jgi:hypothetical protein
MKTVDRMSGPNKNPIEAAAPGRDLCLDFRRAPIQTVLSYIHTAVGLKIAVESNVEIERLIDLCCEKPVSKENALTMLQQALSEKGYTAIHHRGVLAILKSEDAKKRYIPLPAVGYSAAE